MFIKLTAHYKGKFPIDAGGVIFGGYGQKQVSDKLGKSIVERTFPMVVDCDSEGNVLREVPPVKVAVFVDEAVKEEPKVSLPVSTTGTTTAEAVNADVQGEDEVQPTIEPVNSYDEEADEAEDREEEDKEAGDKQDKKKRASKKGK